jgi:hypothetical protein
MVPTAARLPGLIEDLTFVGVEVQSAWTHPDEANKGLLDFLKGCAPSVPRAGMLAGSTALE